MPLYNALELEEQRDIGAETVSGTEPFAEGGEEAYQAPPPDGPGLENTACLGACGRHGLGGNPSGYCHRRFY